VPECVGSCIAAPSLLIVWVYLHSNFRDWLRRTHVIWNRVHNGCSRSIPTALKLPLTRILTIATVVWVINQLLFLSGGGTLLRPLN